MPEIHTSAQTVFISNPGETLLDAASQAGVQLPYSCKSGRCGTCKCRVITGETRVLQAEAGLTPAEQEAGWILSCVRTAISDLVLDVQDFGGIEFPAPRTLPCKINTIEHLASDVIRILLRLPPTADFKYLPGQSLDLIAPGGIRRSYSIANAFMQAGALEMHVRAVQNGLMSRFLLDTATSGTLMHLHGPLGTFALRDPAGKDLIFLATGTGIAPVKALLESLPLLKASQAPASVTLLWGGRYPEDLYLDFSKMPVIDRYIPVLSRADGTWQGACGHVQDVLLRSKPQLGNATVYACGSYAMIRDAREALLAAGLPMAQFHADAFVCSAPIRYEDH